MESKKPRNRTRIVGLAVLLGTMLTAPAADAASPNSTIRDIRIVDEGSSLSVKATLLDVDRNHDVRVQLRARAVLELACINPAGQRVPSQRPNNRNIELEGQAFFPRSAVSFGGLNIRVETQPAPRRIQGAPHCPNSNWTERVERVRFTEMRMVARQGNRTRADLRCFFNPPTMDGRIPSSRMTCFGD